MSSTNNHMNNHGLVSSMKGAEIEAFKVAIGASGAVGAIEQCKSNFIDSITKTSTGLYTIQMTLPYPPVEVCIIPKMSLVATTDALRRIEYVEGSYNASAGTFQLEVTDQGGTPAVADPVSGCKIHCICIFRRYTNE